MSSQGWNSTIPTTATNIIDIPILFPANWQAFENILGLEHYTFSYSTSGRHLPGRTCVLSSGATSGISGISPAGNNGATAFDEYLGQFRLYTAGEWTYVSSLPQTSIKAWNGGADQNIPPSGAVVRYDVAQDYLQNWGGVSEFNETTYVFTPSGDGYFLLETQLCIIGIGGIVVTTKFVHTNADDEQLNLLTSSYMLGDNNRTTVRNHGILPMSAGDKFYVFVSHNRTMNIVIDAGQERTFLKIKRLS